MEEIRVKGIVVEEDGSWFIKHFGTKAMEPAADLLQGIDHLMLRRDIEKLLKNGDEVEVVVRFKRA